jgi:hypothetical protein
MSHVRLRKAFSPRPGTVQELVWPSRESKPSRPKVIHMARTGAKGTFCGRTADPTNSIDPYTGALPRPQDRWCKRCYAETVHVSHPGPVGFADGYSDDPERHIIRFGRPL